jgi:hypothetical protein
MQLAYRQGIQACAFFAFVLHEGFSYGAVDESKNSYLLLTQLKQCLAEVKASKADDYTSPCARMNVDGLKGIALDKLEEALGPHGISSDDYVHYGVDGKRVVDPYERRWAFYKLKGLGGGPELQCVSHDKKTCDQVRWVQTQ